MVAPMSRDAPLRTVHVNTERTWRGGEELTLTLARGLAARGHLAEVVARPGSPMAERARAAGLTVHEVRMRSEVDLLSMLKLRGIFQQGRFDVLHFHTPHAVTIGGMASLARRGGRKSVRLVNKRTDFSIFRNSFLGLNRLKYDRLVDAIIADSKKIEEVLRADGIAPERIRVVYEGVDLDRLRGGAGERLRAELAIPAGAEVVGNVAHFAPHKGQVDLVRAVPLVLKRRPGAVFVLVGQGELLDELRALARELGVAEAVRFPGFRTDIADFLDLFHVFVMSSREEGLCTSIIDAMAVGTPVVGTRAGGIPELVIDGETGLLAPVADPEGLAATIIRALDDPSGAASRAEAAGRRVRSLFSADSMVEGTLAVYRELLARSNGAA
jgi:glycosyltransferase involved in cell wall biosynthesis